MYQWQQLFKQRLGPRVDILETSLQSWNQDPQHAENDIRLQAMSLMDVCQEQGYDGLASAALAVQTSSTTDLHAHTRALIEAMRQAMGSPPRPGRTVLLIGEDRAFFESVARQLQSVECDVYLTESAIDVEHLLLHHGITVIVSNLELTDMPGHTFLLQLKANPLTRVQPVIVVTQKLSRQIKRLLHPEQGDRHVHAPAAPEQVAHMVQQELPRAWEITRTAFYDPETGALNRTALCAFYDHNLQAAQPDHHRFHLAVIAANGIPPGTGLTPGELPQHLLPKISDALRSTFRAQDIVARWDDSHFAILLIGEDQAGGERAIEKVLDRIHDQEFSTPDGSPYRIHLSAGLAVIDPGLKLSEAVQQARSRMLDTPPGRLSIQTPAEDPAPALPARILLFGQESQCQLFNKLLAPDNMHVVTATSSDPHALPPRPATTRYRLIIIDGDVIPSDDLDLLQQLRRDPRYNRVPIVLLTHDESKAARALDLGANGILSKPIVPDLFLQRIRNLLQQQETASSSSALTLLIGDQDISSLIIAGTALHKHGGFRVLLAKDEQELLDRLQRESPNVLLVSLNISGPEHTDFWDALIAHTSRHGTPILLAQDSAQPKIRPPRIKIVGMVKKPYRAQTLHRDVQALLNLPEQTGPDSDLPDGQLDLEIRRLLTND